ncbi:Glycoside hydrolase, family 1 [Corchorus olitorius]|uniref:mRNA export factor GLE1 n=1 Tax=Corchorus olitorius TaxID=93759 RepID=A0A1R3HNU3_9ROSI|nr:Glycoside hydrolase, family 1 [Corchorus olitorius]
MLHMRKGNIALVIITLVVVGIPAALAEINRASFPQGFVFGTASSAYQYEGAVKEGGRGLTIWDTFANSGKIDDGSNADVAVDHYHRYVEDIQLMKDMGMDAYRFSIAWSRIFPNGSGEINQEGVDHYNNLINALLAQGIEPYVTLYHWDLPQALQDNYIGWLDPQIIKDFTVYAETCFEKFGDRVKHWITFNEPRTFALQGYYSGLDAPGRCSCMLCNYANETTEPYIVAHNVLLSHAAVADIYRKNYKDKQNGLIGISLPVTWYEPDTNATEDIEATQRAQDFQLGCCVTDAAAYAIQDIALFIISAAFKDGQPIGDRANSIWLYIVPSGMRSLMQYIKEKYGNPLVFITENGMDDPNDSSIPIEEALKDEKRIKYYNDYLTNLLAAIVIMSFVVANAGKMVAMLKGILLGLCWIIGNGNQGFSIKEFPKSVVIIFTMGAVKLEIRCPRNLNGIGIEPDPDWSFDALLSELDSLEKKLNNVSSSVPLPFTKIKPREIYGEKGVKRSPNALVMKISDEDSESEAEEVNDRALVKAAQFKCDEFYLRYGIILALLFNFVKCGKFLSECMVKELIFNVSIVKMLTFSGSDDDSESDNEWCLEAQTSLMDEAGLHQVGVKEEIRDRISALETDLMNETEKSCSAQAKVEKYREARLEVERKIDVEYQRRIAQGLDNYLTAIQRDHELESQIEERRITSDSAHEEKAKVEAEAKPKLIMAAESGLKQERERLEKLKEWDIEIRNQLSVRYSSSNVDFGSTERHIGRLIRQIRGTRDNVRRKASELINIFNNPQYCPQAISIGYFAKKVVSHCESPDNAAFACGYVIVLVTSQFPQAMDLVVAQLQRACIYIVPKHISYSNSSAFESREAYLKAIGYQEDQDGKIESSKDYLKRLESYMKLYGALVQTEVPGCPNFHGLEQGWAWLARFLNALPANIYTAVALNAFLQMAGFALFTNYKSQFIKLLNIVSGNFLNALRAQEDPELRPIMAEIQAYLEDKKFLQQPEGRTLQAYLLSTR